MKKPVLCAVLSLALCLPSPALAAEETGFSDVSGADWFAPYVEVCTQEGLLNGVGDGRFDPQGQVTMGQVIVMSARVFWQANGGSGPLPQGGTAEELARICTGKGAEEYLPILTEGFERYEGGYAWDGLYYLYTQDRGHGFTLPDFHFCDPSDPATRQAFFTTLGFAAQGLELEAINEVDGIPDLRGGYVSDLYRAGILSGVDEYGTFAAERFLTRSEAAAALARIARPELRLRFTLTPSPMPQALAELEAPVKRLGGSSAVGTVDLEHELNYRDDLVITDLEGNMILDYGQLGYERINGWYSRVGYAVLQRGEEYGLVFPSGKILFPWPSDDHSFLHSDGALLMPETDGSYTIYDNQGNVLSTIQGRTGLADGGEGLLLYTENGNQGTRWGYLNREGQVVIPAAYERAAVFSEGLAAVAEGQSPDGDFGRPVFSRALWGYIDRSGQPVIPCQFERVGAFSEGLAEVQDDSGLWGYIDQTGETVIPCQFDYAAPFSNGLALVTVYGRDENGDFLESDTGWRVIKYGIIDRQGGWVAPPIYDMIEKFNSFSNGWAPFARMEGDTKVFGYLAPDGTEHLFDQFDHVNRSPELPLPFAHGYVPFYEGKKWGLMDADFQVVLPAQFQSLEVASGGRVLARYDGVYYLVELGER